MTMETNVAPVITNQETVAAQTAPSQVEQQQTSTEEKESPTLVDEAVESSQKNMDASEKKEAVDKVIPDKYDIKVPEGITLDSATLDLFTPIFKELGITAEGAQKLVDAYIPLIQGSADKVRQESLDSYKKIVDGWKEETMKVLGPEAKSQLAYVGKALNKYGSLELREILNETGVGNHKAIVDFLAKVGRTISEDSFVDGSSPSKGDPLKTLYPSMQQ